MFFQKKNLYLCRDKKNKKYTKNIIKMGTYYFSDKNGQQQGPVSKIELTKHGITDSTMVWKEGMSKWQVASSLPELSDLFQSHLSQPQYRVDDDMDLNQIIKNRKEAVNKKMEFTLLDGEEILTEIEGTLSFSPHPMMRIFFFLLRIWWAIIGKKLRIYIVITNLRIVKITKKTLLWGLLLGSISVDTLKKSTILSVGYSMESSWFVFRRYYFKVSNSNVFDSIRIVYKGKKEKLLEACRIMDKLVTQT